MDGLSPDFVRITVPHTHFQSQDGGFPDPKIFATTVKLFTEKSASEEGSVFNLSQHIYPMTYAIAARASFGKKSKYQEMFISLIKEQLSLIGGFSIADLYPSIGLLQIMAKAKVEKVHREVDRVLQDIIDQHKNRKSTDREAVEDLVDVLLKFRWKMNWNIP
ncbi:hypothetical protein JHK86_002506 [Glycine max]|nr:hypothetical protein JHK86_002506 [Glycine max]